MAQNGTLADLQQVSSDVAVSAGLLRLQQDQWITFCALGGLVTLESDSNLKSQGIQQMTVSEFSEAIGVPRRTLYNWKQSIPSFGLRVRDRRLEVFSLSRETALFNRAYLIAMTSKDHKAAVDAIKMLLGHFSKLELATKRHEVKASQNLIELVNIARKKK